jgi:hypothetical protein
MRSPKEPYVSLLAARRFYFPAYLRPKRYTRRTKVRAFLPADARLPRQASPSRLVWRRQLGMFLHWGLYSVPGWAPVKHVKEDPSDGSTIADMGYAECAADRRLAHLHLSSRMITTPTTTTSPRPSIARPNAGSLTPLTTSFAGPEPVTTLPSKMSPAPPAPRSTFWGATPRSNRLRRARI